MKKYDFLIIYQIKARELENCLLLKNELQRRGYSVRIDNLYGHSQRTKRYDADVIISQADDEWMMSTCRFFVNDPKKIISFKWEQIFNNGSCDIPSTTRSIRNRGKEAVTFAWGDVTYNRYTKIYGVPEKNIKKTGHITMDFLRPEFRCYFKSREEICSEFGLDTNKKIYTYISSFSYPTISLEELNSYRNQESGINVNRLYEVSVTSQKLTLEWIGKELEKHPGIQFIYRPHPVEKDSELLRSYAEKYNNFHIISDYSVKQWIIVSDKLYTWFSTSIGEVYFAKKACSVIRPVSIPQDDDTEIYKNAKIISNYEEFDKDFDHIGSFETDFPIPHEDMDSYYYIPDNSYTFELEADICEEMLKDDSYLINDFPLKRYPEKGLKFKIKCIFRRYLGSSSLCMALSKSLLKGTKFADTVNLNREDHNDIKKNVPSKKEMKRLERNISVMLENRKGVTK